MGPQQAIDVPRVDCSSETIDVDTNLNNDVIAELKTKGHNVRVLGQEYSQTGLAKFASPVAIRKNGIIAELAHAKRLSDFLTADRDHVLV